MAVSSGSTRTRVIGLLAVAALLLIGGITFLAVRSSDGEASGTEARPSSAPAPSSTSESAPPPRTGPVEVRYVAPSATGAGDGSSWADAGELADVPDLLDQLPAAGEIWLRADTGPYEVSGSLRITASGVDGAPVVVRGVDAEGAPLPAVLQGSRTTPYDPDGESGGDVFSLRGGASHLAFRDLALENVDNAFLAAGDVTDVVIADVSATNVRRFFENTKSDEEPSANVSELVIRNVTVTGFSKRVVRLRYESNDVLLEDVVGDSQQQDGDDFAIGVHLEDEVHDVMLRRVSMSNTRDSLHEYWNGDGFATERGVHDITFEDTTATGNTDAGYDLKSSATTLVNAVASDNKRNFRFWADDLVARDCVGEDPLKRGGSSSQAQVWLGEDAQVLLEGCSLSDDDPETVVFVLESGAQLTMDGGDIEHAGELEALQQGSDVELRDVVQ